MMRLVWLTALLFAFASLVSGVILIFWLALRGESYTAYILQCVLSLAFMGVASIGLRQQDNRKIR